MRQRSTLVAVGSALLTLTLLGSGANAWSARGTGRLTFSGPVGLPGVTLGTGTYVFERMESPINPRVVLVRNAATSQVYFLGFTRAVQRPAGLADDRQIIFKESPKGVAPLIDAWYPVGESAGEQFIYPKGR